MPTEEELKQYFNYLNESWQFLKKHLARSPDKSDEFWDSVRKEASEIEERNGHNQFSVDLIVACMNEFDRIAKNGKN